MNIVWTPEARDDLENIHAYIARDSLSRAIQVVEAIVVAINRLADFPALGRPGRKSGTRELVIARLPYRVPYRVKGDQVMILRVLHTSRR